MLEEAGTDSPIIETKTMASFRIEREYWAKFGELAKKERLTVTQVLTEYIEKCIESNRTFYGVRMDTDSVITSINPVSIDTDQILKLIDERISTLSLPTADLIEEWISKALTPLQDEISEVTEFSRNLQGEIVKVKKPLAIV